MNLLETLNWNEKSMAQKIMMVFGFVMVFFYIGVGIFVLTYPQFDKYDESTRFGAGALLIAYGLFRIVRVYHKERNSDSI